MEPVNPLPWKQLALICICRFAEPITYSIHLPFIYFMIRSFNTTTEENIGYYCGLLTSVFAMAQFVSGMPMGSLSDRIGRKPVVLFGLGQLSFTILLFGLAKSFTWLLVVKLFSGLLNGNIGVLKSMIAELTKNHTASQRTRAFSLLQVTYGLGSIVGAALGGFLSEPVTKFPSLFKEGAWVTELLKEYPYLLPCLVASVISAMGWLLGLFFLKETLVIRSEEEETPLLQHHGSSSSQEEEISFRKTLTAPILLICAVASLGGFEMLYYEVLFPTWASTPSDKGGLGFKPNDIGTILSCGGLVMLFTQLVVLHRLTHRFSMVRILQCCLFLAFLDFFIVGLCRSLQGGWIWAGLLMCMTVQTVAQTSIMTLSVILLNGSVVHANTLGFINGFQQCCNSAARMLSPVITGLIWSSVMAMTEIPLDIRSYISWAILGLVGIFTFFVSTRLDPTSYAKM
ncbi:MFS general substrate transporter, partial [Backusella circina FSU 941]